MESGRRAEEAVDLLAERRGQELLGAGTLAGGADRCDFRYVVRAGRAR